MCVLWLIGLTVNQCPLKRDSAIGVLDVIPSRQSERVKELVGDLQASRSSWIGYLLLIGMSADLLSLVDWWRDMARPTCGRSVANCLIFGMIPTVLIVICLEPIPR
jgi:hypothetical protein